jgi:hypothetical protein
MKGCKSAPEGLRILGIYLIELKCPTSAIGLLAVAITSYPTHTQTCRPGALFGFVTWTNANFIFSSIKGRENPQHLTVLPTQYKVHQNLITALSSLSKKTPSFTLFAMSSQLEQDLNHITSKQIHASLSRTCRPLHCRFA